MKNSTFKITFAFVLIAVSLCLGIALAEYIKEVSPALSNKEVELTLDFSPLLVHHNDPVSISLSVFNYGKTDKAFTLKAKRFDKSGKEIQTDLKAYSKQPPNDNPVKSGHSWPSRWTFPDTKNISALQFLLYDGKGREYKEKRLSFRLLREYDRLPGGKIELAEKKNTLRITSTKELLIFIPTQRPREEDRSWVWAKKIYKSMVDHKLSARKIALLGDEIYPDTKTAVPYHQGLVLPESKNAEGKIKREFKFFPLSRELAGKRPIVSALLAFETKILPYKPELLLLFLGSFEQGQGSKPHEYRLLFEWMARRLKNLGRGETVLISPIAAPQAGVFFKLSAIAQKTESAALKSLIKKILENPEDELKEGTKRAVHILKAEHKNAKGKEKKDAIKSLIQEFTGPENGLILLCSEDVPTGLHDYIRELKALSADEKLPLWRLDKYLFQQDRKTLRARNPEKKILYPNLSWRLDEDEPSAVTRFPTNAGQRKIQKFIEEQLDLILYTGPDPY